MTDDAAREAVEILRAELIEAKCLLDQREQEYALELAEAERTIAGLRAQCDAITQSYADSEQDKIFYRDRCNKLEAGLRESLDLMVENGVPACDRSRRLVALAEKEVEPR